MVATLRFEIVANGAIALPLLIRGVNIKTLVT